MSDAIHVTSRDSYNYIEAEITGLPRSSAGYPVFELQGETATSSGDGYSLNKIKVHSHIKVTRKKLRHL